ncbi:uncharacterized protein LOC119269643 [Triticum dicoccoides]|uniref:uncharacterized protein LOC119269643 n=1 Tax=Triticum dicoccoides TaxID=85692 RepID=UPI0018901E99|nr:uncharacterized protein LOC119269643 [Triticum dicoccoides]
MRRLFVAAWPHLLISFLLVAPQSKAASSFGATAGRPEWQVLTRANFSSQIRLHPHILLVVTMPWYGESRSLMAEIQQLVATEEMELGRLKLMVVYRNSEKLLSDAIGATEGTKFIYYQQSIQFKYQGKLRARDILYSVRHIMPLKHEEAPFVALHTKDDVEEFIQSTDRAVLLSEFCGWFTRLASDRSNRSSGVTPSKTHAENVDVSGKTVTRQSDGRLELVIEDDELTFGGGSQLTGSPWKGGFTTANQSVSDHIRISTDENSKLCTVQKFQQFESFYAKLTALSREHFLPPEKVRFGLVTEKLPLSSLDIANASNSETWFLSVHYLGCTSCSVIAKEEDDLRSLLQSYHNLDVKEIDTDASGGEVTFPANRPSAILFINRLSDSLKIRDESKLSLKLLREYAQKNYPPYVISGDLNSGNSRMRTKADPSALSTSKSDGHSGTARLHDLASKYMDLGEKMSVMVVRDGESISYRSASEGSTNSPLYEILTKLIHKTRSAHRSKKTRISFVTKNDDLKLLSDDPEVQVVDSVSIQESQRMDDLFASSESVNDGIAEVSVHENNKATKVEYIDDGQTPTILEKTPAHYCGINDNDLHCSDTEMEEQQAVEASDVSPDLREEASIDVHSSNEVHGKLQKHRDEKIVTEVLDFLEPDGRKANSNKEKSGLPNQQDVFSVLSQESERIENFISEDDLFNIDEESEKGGSKFSPRATFSSSSILASDNTEYTEQVTSSISDNHFVGSFFFSDGGHRLLRTLTGGSRMPSLVIIDPVQQKHYVFPQESEFSYPSLAIFFDSFVNRSLSPYYRSASSVISSKELPRPPLVNQDFHEANSIPLLTASSFCRLVFGFEGCDSKNETPFLNTATLGVAWKKDVLVLFSNSWCGFCQRTELVVRELHRSFKSYMSLNSQFAKAQGLQTEENGGDLGLPTIYMMDCTANDCHHLLKSADKEELYPTVLLFPAENKSAISYGGGMSLGNLIEFLESHASNSRHMSEYKGFLRKKRMVMQHEAPQTVRFHMKDKSGSNVGSDPPSQPEKRKVHIVTGSILDATEKLGAAVPFDNARVLIVSADSHEGFHGLIINKRLSLDTLKNLDSSLEPIKLAPLFYGGPVVVQGYHLVSLSRAALEGYTPVIPDLYYGNIIATGRVIAGIRAGEQSAEDLWFFLGYAGWGYSQLFDELSEGAWHVSAGPIRHLEWPDS